MCDKKKLLQEYLNTRKDAGESGFWIEKNVVCKSDELESLKQKALSCAACPLGQYRLNACFGNGNPEADLMFIGEGPGFEEDHRGVVFVGRAGKLLDKIIESTLGLKRKEVYITNIVKCHPMKDPKNPEKRGNDRPPSEEEANTCIELYLKKQISIIRPKIIAALGSPSAKMLLKTETGITGIRGQEFERNFADFKARIIPTYHPAYLLRNPPKKKEVFEDMKLIRSMLCGT